jgi:transcriptional regulator with XRE-family HTH domain
VNVEIWKAGFALQLFRQIRGLSRQRLAKKCGVSVADLKRAERGEISLELEDLHEALNVVEFSFGDVELLYLYCQQLARRIGPLWAT